MSDPKSEVSMGFIDDKHKRHVVVLGMFRKAISITVYLALDGIN